ncbi:MAG: radical SAM protein, partial [Patescibacteria group bacterium]
MKILLINSPVWLISGKSIAESPPLGLLYLASVLEKNKYQVKVIDADILKLDKQSLSHRIKLENPDIIGIGSTTLGLPALFKTVDICKKAQLRAKIITGGAGTSIEPENVLITNKNIDVAFINEAEESIINWLSVLKNGQSFKKVKGIAFLDNGKFFKTEAQLPPQNLDDIPFPAYHLLEPAHNDYHGVSGEWEGIDIPNAVIMGSRGCPHRCIFCSNKTRQPRRRSPKNIVDEIEFNKKNFNINSVQFYDNEFIGMTADQNQWVKLICKEIIDRKLNKLGYLIQGRCNKFVDLETLKMMRRAGFRWIWWG